MDFYWKSTLYIIKRGQINWGKWDGVKELKKKWYLRISSQEQAEVHKAKLVLIMLRVRKPKMP